MAKLVVERKNVGIYMPTSGGKAGKGCNKTSTIQVRKFVSMTEDILAVVDNAGKRENFLKRLGLTTRVEQRK
jgi:hypothetical protein